MPRKQRWIATLGLFFLLSATAGQSRGSVAVPLLGNGSLDSLAGSLRGYLISALPNPLLEVNSGWGRTRPVANGVKWRGKGLHVHPEVQYANKNDGTWRRVRITAEQLPRSLVLDLRNWQQPPHGAATFDAFIASDARLEYERQTWSEGIRLYSGSTRARFRVQLSLHCEIASRLDKTAGVVPDVLLRLRVLKADVGYDNFVVEHVAGVGGEAAKLIGNAARGCLRRFHPSLERDLLAKASAAIVKAADTKEVRIGLDRLLGP